ncbi:hypothetical protein AB0F92_31680 [Kitasatospora aureofaciens]|uniref:hypothetical protein n=1 Tax=Kitasatospora aureofaciens TaxID=1894 RepID=UPI0033DEAC71
MTFAAAASAVAFALKQVETTIPVVTSVAKKLIDARREITEYYRTAGRVGTVEPIAAPAAPHQAPAPGEAVRSTPPQRAA